MATLTLDLPEAPRAQPAYRLAADCPCCGAPLVLRQNRQTATLFTGCSAYPGCTFSEPHDPRVQALSTEVAYLFNNPGRS
jgi:ssDNA-binding Zn-finger/Zn-ribbon topoisomerase 1